MLNQNDRPPSPVSPQTRMSTPPARRRGRPPTVSGPAQPRPAAPCEPLVDAGAIAALLSIPRGYVYDLAKRGTIPSIRVGKYLRFSMQAVSDALRTPLGKRPPC